MVLFTEECTSFPVYRKELGRYTIAPRKVGAGEELSVGDRITKEKEKQLSSGASASSVNTAVVEPRSHRGLLRDTSATGNQAEEEKRIGDTSPLIKDRSVVVMLV